MVMELLAVLAMVRWRWWPVSFSRSFLAVGAHSDNMVRTVLRIMTSGILLDTG